MDLDLDYCFWLLSLTYLVSCIWSLGLIKIPMVAKFQGICIVFPAWIVDAATDLLTTRQKRYYHYRKPIYKNGGTKLFVNAAESLKNYNIRILHINQHQNICNYLKL